MEGCSERQRGGAGGNWCVPWERWEQWQEHTLEEASVGARCTLTGGA